MRINGNALKIKERASDVQNLSEFVGNSSVNSQQIYESVRESTVAIEEVAKTAQCQAELAQKLSELIGRFKI